MTKSPPHDTPASTPRTGQRDLTPHERLSLITLIDEGMRSGLPETPIVSDLFNNLWDLVSVTVSGSRINRVKPEDSRDGLRVFEINAETGETLGRLNMLYLRKPISCYYLVYVEVAAPFRRKGLGSRIIKYFGDFLVRKSAVGILDNIIPEDDPTYDIYRRQAWRPIASIVGDAVLDGNDSYMIFIPQGLQGKDLKEPVLKLLYHLKRKRTAIDIKDNEVMVQRTIAEFKALYQALLTYFDTAINDGESSDFMRFMFTRFVTKFIAFRRRIGNLVGYTGGESMEQIILPTEIAGLPVKSYAPRELAYKPSPAIGDQSLLSRLPKDLQDEPARVIESLPNYRRPSFMAWLQEKGKSYSDTLIIGDLMDLGFDPTRLKEIMLDGEAFIFERVQARQLAELQKKNDLLDRIASEMSGVKVKNAWLKTNPILMATRDRGNAYVLRRKVGGIHWEEAIEQLQCHPVLKGLNASMRFDNVILATVRKANESIAHHVGMAQEIILDQLTTFVPWDLENNRPHMVIDFGGNHLESVWMA
jgi:hypothetical protein